MATQKLNGAPKSFSAQIAGAAMQASIQNTLRDKARADRFTANLITMVSHTPKLAECDPKTVVSAALLGETLNLNPAPALGQYYVVPYKKQATFILGYRGALQLAIRSGEFRRFNALAIKEGEFRGWNPLTEEFRADIIENEDERERRPIIGFYAMFETINGFRKETYWSLERVFNYAERFGNGNFDRKVYAQFLKEVDKGAALQSLQAKYGPWYLHFETMACKSLIRQLLKFAPMSPDLQRATAHDERTVAVTTGGEFDSATVDVEVEAPVVADTGPVSAPPAAALPAPEENPTIDLGAPAADPVPAGGDVDEIF